MPHTGSSEKDYQKQESAISRKFASLKKNKSLKGNTVIDETIKTVDPDKREERYHAWEPASRAIDAARKNYVEGDAEFSTTLIDLARVLEQMATDPMFKPEPVKGSHNNSDSPVRVY